MSGLDAPNLADIQAAAARIGPHVHRTPVLTSRTLDAACGGRLAFKAEFAQCISAFKARGAANAVMRLSPEALARGVATHSSGNHAAALARAARLCGATASIVMPSTAPLAKQASVARYGGQIVFCEPTLAAREAATAEIVARTGATLIHPYDNVDVIAGQGTVALELIDQARDLDLILAPVGGGGLISGLAIAAHGLNPNIEVVAVEPAGADDAYRSVQSGRLMPAGPVDTIADGLRGALSARTFSVMQSHDVRVVTVSEAAIIAAMRQLWEVLKAVVEPSAAVAYAAIMDGRIDVVGKRVGIVLTGGNLDLDRLPWQI